MQVEIKELGVKVCKFVSCVALREGLRLQRSGNGRRRDATVEWRNDYDYDYD